MLKGAILKKHRSNSRTFGQFGFALRLAIGSANSRCSIWRSTASCAAAISCTCAFAMSLTAIGSPRAPSSCNGKRSGRSVLNHGAHPKIGLRLDLTLSAQSRRLSASEQDTTVAESVDATIRQNLALCRSRESVRLFCHQLRLVVDPVLDLRNARAHPRTLAQVRNRARCNKSPNRYNSRGIT